MTTIFQAHLGDEEGVCSDHRNLKTTRPPHQLSGTPGTRLVRAPRKEHCGVRALCLSERAWFLSLAFSVCLLACVDSGVWRVVRPTRPRCGVADKKPSVCLPGSASGPRAACQAGVAGWRFCWPASQRPFQWAPGKQGGEDLGAGSTAGVHQPVKQSQGGRQVSVTETSTESTNTKAHDSTQRLGTPCPGWQAQHPFQQQRHMFFWQGRGQGSLGSSWTSVKGQKGGGETLQGSWTSSLAVGLEVHPTSKPEINSNTPPSEKVELFLRMQAFALKLFQKSKM